MSDLISVMNVAVNKKPKMGQPCNHCGYCCLTEVCSVGQELTGKSFGPCTLLVTEGDEHRCKLIVEEQKQGDSTLLKDTIGAGVGCCAETQQETFARLGLV
ncbi:hypothetical protein [Vibrio owensii]|uniref:hypothetical protein n=1 Tax=Vibrio harveyi group TaxID=717610 RepID=UPI003CC60E58